MGCRDNRFRISKPPASRRLEKYRKKVETPDADGDTATAVSEETPSLTWLSFSGLMGTTFQIFRDKT
jgi:hypothetical protein